MSDWEAPAFLADARSWIASSLTGCGLRLTGEIEQPHVRPWSTVLRVPTDGGDVWFKALAPGGAHDVAVTVALARMRPDLVLVPLAVDLDRSWMLLPDGGVRLREVLARERSPRRWFELLPLYAGLQLESVPDVEMLLARGVPDFRLARLPGLSENLGSQLGLESPPRASVASLCEELAAYGIPETIQHDDLHDGNVFVRGNGGHAVFDWGDSCITHPFASLVVCLRGVAYRFELGEQDPDVERLRGVYLGAWRRFGTSSALNRAAELASAVGMLCRALTWWRVSCDSDETTKAEYAEGAREWYGEFAGAVSAGARGPAR
jgi:hypothetical protein